MRVRGVKGRSRQSHRLDGQLPPPWAAYGALMACHLVVLDKRPGVRLVNIGETLHQALAKLVMRAAGDQAKTACGNIQLCTGLDVSIEGATHAVGQRRMERVRPRRAKTDDETETEAEGEEGGEVLACLHNLSIETAVTEEEAAEGLEDSLGISTHEMEVEGDGGSEGEEGGGGTQRALEALEFLTQDVELSGTTLVDACNSSNELSRLAMLWTVRHR